MTNKEALQMLFSDVKEVEPNSFDVTYADGFVYRIVVQGTIEVVCICLSDPDYET